MLSVRTFATSHSCEDLLPSSGHNIWLHGVAEGDSCSFVRSRAREFSLPMFIVAGVSWDLPQPKDLVRRAMTTGSSDSSSLAALRPQGLRRGHHSRPRLGAERATSFAGVHMRCHVVPCGARTGSETPKLHWDHSAEPKPDDYACCSCGLGLLLTLIGNEEIGMLEWDSEHGSMGDYPGPHAVLKGGAESIATRLSSDAERRGVHVLWQQRARENHEDPSCVVVHCRSGLRCHARWAVLTASLGVLKKMGPDFVEPALPTVVQDALSRLKMCHYNKLLLHVTEQAAARFPVWTDIDSPLFWQLFNYWPLNGKPLLSLASIIPEAQTLSDEEARQVAEQLLALLPDELLAVQMTRWGEVEWTLGSYSMSTKDAAFKLQSAAGSALPVSIPTKNTRYEANQNNDGCESCSAEQDSKAMKNDDISEGSRELVDLSAEAISSLGIHLSQIGQIISKSSLPPNRGDRSSAHKLKEKLEMYQGYTDEVQRRRNELEQKMADDFARLKAWRAQSGTEGKGLVEELEALYGKVRQQDKELKRKQQAIEEEQAKVKELEEAVALRERKWDSLAEDYSKKLVKMRREIVERGGLCSWLQCAFDEIRFKWKAAEEKEKLKIEHHQRMRKARAQSRLDVIQRERKKRLLQACMVAMQEESVEGGGLIAPSSGGLRT
ncbi:PAO3 [Symbiodinium natans]|uniref:PAO3 protein n=1 Tax=Symbiodinium natans TaxID=878477 RepID=A0A812HYS6_9DINO|nr:PAO3 [Symbiodinium natans]